MTARSLDETCVEHVAILDVRLRRHHVPQTFPDAGHGGIVAVDDGPGSAEEAVEVFRAPYGS